MAKRLCSGVRSHQQEQSDNDGGSAWKHAPHSEHKPPVVIVSCMNDCFIWRGFAARISHSAYYAISKVSRVEKSRTVYLVVCTNLRLCDAQFLVFILQLIKLPINAALAKQLLVGSNFADVAFVHHDDLVSALNGRETVRDDDRCPALNHAGEGFTHSDFGFGIDAGGGFVQHKNLGIVCESAGKRNELLLAGAHGTAALQYGRFEAFS